MNMEQKVNGILTYIQTIFADNSYSKPYFVTYINTTFFIIPLIPMFIHHLWLDRSNTIYQKPLLAQLSDLLSRRAGKISLLRDHESSTSSISSKSHSRSSDNEAAEVLLGDSMHASQVIEEEDEGLTLRETAKLALEFCILWFLANYFAAACLEYTTVASSTILASTSSIWTLLSGSLMRVERFTLRKLIGVCASLAGVVLISMVDVSGETDENRGSFPHKTPRELAVGDVMAFVSAVLYGFYAVFMKKRIGDESRVNMPLFFGLVGLWNTILLWPGFLILHFTGIEKFSLPPTGRILMIVLVNSASSLVSDFCWAYSMLLTSPLIVTVGLSLTIPLSLVGQIVLDAQYASIWYWVGALIVVLSFVFINHEDRKDEEERTLEGQEPVVDLRHSFQSVRQSLSRRNSSVRDSLSRRNSRTSV
jgi:solute carrier family 35 protein F5